MHDNYSLDINVQIHIMYNNDMVKIWDQDKKSTNTLNNNESNIQDGTW